jgi:hypothetical protein
MEILFSIQKIEEVSKFSNFSKEAKMFVQIYENIFLIQPDSFLIYSYDFEMSKLKIYFE